VTVRFTWAEVCARRLDRHFLTASFLTAPSDRAMADVVAAMCGAHAQVMSAAELSVGVRLAGSTRTDVRDALWTHKSLVKTYGPRGTVHLLPARDLPMWIGALAAIPGSPTSLPETARLTPAQTDAVLDAIGVAVRGAELTVDELDAAVVAATGPWAADPVVPAFGDFWPRWRQAITVAAYRGVLCFGPARGRRVTYTDPHAWLPGFRPEDGAPALAELIRRFLSAYGPATPYEFARWFGAPRAWCIEAFAAMGDELVPAVIEERRSGGRSPGPGDTPRVLGVDAVGRPEPLAPSLRLLPYFDAYTVGGHPRDLLFPGTAATRALTHGQAGTFPVVLIGGTVAGRWHQRASGRRVHIVVEPFGRLTAGHRRELDEQVARVGEILEAGPELTIGPVTVSGHK
jgi:Winged helix DNA-binding domain